MKKLFAAALAAVLLASTAPAKAQLSAKQTWGGTAGGSANAQTLSIDNLSQISDLLGVPIRFVPFAVNTGAATININGYGNSPILKMTPNGLAALTGGEIGGASAGAVEMFWDGSEFVLIGNYNPSVAPYCTSTACPIGSHLVGFALASTYVSADPGHWTNQGCVVSGVSFATGQTIVSFSTGSCPAGLSFAGTFNGLTPGQVWFSEGLAQHPISTYLTMTMERIQ